MTERERLIELLKYQNCPSPMLCDKNCKYAHLESCYEERTADHLLANGVIVPECKVGDEIFFIHHINDVIPDFITSDTVTKVGVTTKGILSEVGVDFTSFGKTVFLTREEAEASLAERSENDDKRKAD